MVDTWAVNMQGLAQPDGFLPLRNLLLVAGVVAQLGAGEVALGSSREDVHRDNSPAFREGTGALVSYLLDREVTVVAPLWEFETKGEALAYALRAMPDLRPAILRTRSCYVLGLHHIRGTTVGCGQCKACVRRRAAWDWAKLPAQQYDTDLMAQLPPFGMT